MTHLSQTAVFMLVAAGFAAALSGCTQTQESKMEAKTEVAEAADALKAGPITGRCHCGHITYEAQGPAIKCSYCDCPGCRRATGTLKAPFVTIGRDAFRLTGGEVSQFRATGGERCDCHGVWHFCPRCGTQVYWMPNDGKQIDIFAGTLDDPSVFKPGKAS